MPLGTKHKYKPNPRRAANPDREISPAVFRGNVAPDARMGAIPSATIEKVRKLAAEKLHAAAIGRSLGIHRATVLYIGARHGILIHRKVRKRRRTREERVAAQIQAGTERFHAQVDQRGPDECWNWTGWAAAPSKRAPNHIYGRVGFNGKHVYTHRLAYELSKGPIPAGMTVDHICWNTLCCNPAHLQLLTLSQNAARKSPAAPAKYHARLGVKTGPRQKVAA